MTHRCKWWARWPEHLDVPATRQQLARGELEARSAKVLEQPREPRWSSVRVSPEFMRPRDNGHRLEKASSPLCPLHARTITQRSSPQNAERGFGRWTPPMPSRSASHSRNHSAKCPKLGASLVLMLLKDRPGSMCLDVGWPQAWQADSATGSCVLEALSRPIRFKGLNFLDPLQHHPDEDAAIESNQS